MTIGEVTVHNYKGRKNKPEKVEAACLEWNKIYKGWY